MNIMATDWPIQIYNFTKPLVITDKTDKHKGVWCKFGSIEGFEKCLTEYYTKSIHCPNSATPQATFGATCTLHCTF